MEDRWIEEQWYWQYEGLDWGAWYADMKGRV